jgi:hypothetical protein
MATRSHAGQAYDKSRAMAASAGVKNLPDTCRLIVGEDEYENTPCRLSGGSGDIDGAPYRIEFAWGSPAVIGATAIVDAIPGRPQLTMQLVGPVDSSTAIWQEWKATSGPAFGRVDVGL